MKKRDGRISEAGHQAKVEGLTSSVYRSIKSAKERIRGMITMMRFGRNVRRTKRKLMKMASRIK